MAKSKTTKKAPAKKASPKSKAKKAVAKKAAPKQKSVAKKSGSTKRKIEVTFQVKGVGGTSGTVVSTGNSIFHALKSTLSELEKTPLPEGEYASDTAYMHGSVEYRFKTVK